MSHSLRHSCASHPGAVRADNQDAMLCRPELGLYIVADGAGGHAGGREAAERVVASAASLPSALRPAERLAHLRQRLVAVHESLVQDGEARGEGQGMASTMVALLLDEDFFACLWTGDSRVYLLRDGDLIQITHDHSVVQELVDAGMIEPWQAEGHPQAHVITHAIGADSGPLTIDKRVGRIMPRDRFLLCSDGLTKTLDETGIQLVLEQNGDSATSLVEAALRLKARDNVTSIVVTVD